MKVAPVFVNDEEKIKHIVENCLINNVGGLYNKTSQAVKRIVELDNKVRVAAAQKKGYDAMKLSCEAWEAHQNWVCMGGMLVDNDESPRLNKNERNKLWTSQGC